RRTISGTRIVPMPWPGWIGGVGEDLRGRRPISALVTTCARSAAFLHQRGVPVQVQRPALRPVDAVRDGFPAGAVPVDVPVLQLDPGAGRRLGVELHLDLAGLRWVRLDGPP